MKYLSQNINLTSQFYILPCQVKIVGSWLSYQMRFGEKMFRSAKLRQPVEFKTFPMKMSGFWLSLMDLVWGSMGACKLRYLMWK
jgi:hypothetical protein